MIFVLRSKLTSFKMIFGRQILILFWFNLIWFATWKDRVFTMPYLVFYEEHSCSSWNIRIFEIFECQYHLLKIARLVAHHFKKLKFSLGILTFLAIPNQFWKGTGSVWRSFSQLSHKMGQTWSIKIRAQFICFSNVCEL